MTSTSIETARETAAHALRVAVLIPCYNEELTIAAVIRDFRTQLPAAAIYVFDNNSTDRTAEIARAEGAVVRFERRQGKGYVVQSMFRDVDADVYVMVDGDMTYPAAAVHSVIEPVLNGEADMVIGSRLHKSSLSEFKPLNHMGNRFYLWLLARMFGARITDLLSGYRAFSRSLVRSLPLFGGGFETEAEMTIKSLQRGFRIVEVPVNLASRPAGSHSKIRIVRDGFIILNAILTLMRDYKPLTFFGSIGLVLFVAGLIPAAVGIVDLMRGYPSSLAAAIFAVGLATLGTITVAIGLILHTVARHFQELDYLLQRQVDNRGRQRADGR